MIYVAPEVIKRVAFWLLIIVGIAGIYAYVR